VIEMNDAQHNAKFFSQFKQQAQKRGGIRSTGHRHSDAFSRSQKLLSSKTVEQFFDLNRHDCAAPAAAVRMLAAAEQKLTLT